MNEYRARDDELEYLIEKRKKETNEQGIWNYNNEIGKQTQQPYKYQPVKEIESDLDPLKDLIYD